MNLHFSPYSSELHKAVFAFMVEAFPKRPAAYFEYWLNRLDGCPEEIIGKSSILYDSDRIIGLSVPAPARMSGSEGEDLNIYHPGNNIIIPEYRGKGTGRNLYGFRSSAPDWLSIGITEAGLAAIKRYVAPYYILEPMYVYVTLNGRMLFKQQTSASPLGSVSIRRGRLEAVKVEDLRELVPENRGRWTSDRYEMVRDRQFIEERFVSIYRQKEYVAYKILSGTSQVGYFIVRRTSYKRVRSLALVDYRYDCSMLSLNTVLRFVDRIAYGMGIGSVIALTSERMPLICLTPLTIRMKKRLNCATSSKALYDDGNLLLTSADSDLDFVYYR